MIWSFQDFSKWAIDDWTSDWDLEERKEEKFSIFDLPIGELADEKVHQIGGPLEEIHLVRKIA